MPQYYVLFRENTLTFYKTILKSGNIYITSREEYTCWGKEGEILGEPFNYTVTLYFSFKKRILNKHGKY